MAKRKKKKTARSGPWKVFLYTLIIGNVFLLGYFGYVWMKERYAAGIRYKAFGIPIPGSYSIHGIDVSKYQDFIDWESVQEMEVEQIKIGFAFMKATEGVGNKDALFKRNWKKAKEAGITRGAYHFFISSKSGRMQAENFIKTVKLESGDLPPVLDIEQTNGMPPAKIRERALEFLKIVENYYRVTPVIYTNVDFYKQYLKEDFDRYPLWVAHYLRKEGPRIQRDWHFWQHSETGSVNGIGSKVDFNVFSGDSAAFRKLLVP